ncbi:MAG TPA: RNA polymerase sigma factor [Steroidobacteraceae bacterium]|nr:RNA polymerase sigma factor [Steroidobacteraceae bacterium]
MTWVSARYAQLIKLCRARGCSREVAKEFVQEAHLRLFEYQLSTHVKDAESLLRRIVLNLAINHYQRELRKFLVVASIDKLDRLGALIDPSAGPEQTLAAEQELDGVVSLLSAVSPRTCQIFIAQRGGYSYEEIASAFAVKPRTVEKHVASAVLALQEMMPAEFSVGTRS